MGRGDRVEFTCMVTHCVGPTGRDSAKKRWGLLPRSRMRGQRESILRKTSTVKRPLNALIQSLSGGAVGGTLGAGAADEDDFLAFEHSSPPPGARGLGGVHAAMKFSNYLGSVLARLVSFQELC